MKCPKCGGEMTTEDFPRHHEAHHECPKCGYQLVTLYEAKKKASDEKVSEDG